MRRLPHLSLCCALALTACDGSDPVVVDDPQVPIEELLDGAIVVTKNPSGIVTLSAEMVFATKVAPQAEVRVLGPDPVGRTFEAAVEHVLPILGLDPGTTNGIEIRLTDSNGTYGVDTITVSVGSLPDFLPSIAVTSLDSARIEPGWTMSSLSIGDNGVCRTIPIIFDHIGVIRWYLDSSALGDMAFAAEKARQRKPDSR